LDPTTFNKSKRITAEGKQRWPSTESLSKILLATGATMGEFVILLDEEESAALARRMPMIPLELAGNEALFDDKGCPTGTGWDEVNFPILKDSAAFAIEVSGDSFAPIFREGDRVVVAPNVGIRRNDRVALCTKRGKVLLMGLLRETATRVELFPLGRSGEDAQFDRDELLWISRIVWASQ
jgi:phage repressor protein C with HTH and peptisase S24 domain|tara:strand:- start:4857 stop:5399 length:543 start_codon:yes stop_codon:yes gene_type:complete